MAEYVNKSQMIYHSLLENIVRHKYSVDEPLVISRIAKEYRVSELPVREAIHRLEAEGFVCTSANHSATVRDYDFSQLARIYRMRCVLEGYAARVAAEHIQGPELERLRTINEEVRDAHRKRDYSRCGALNCEFHATLYRAGPDQELLATVEQLWKRWSIVREMLDLHQAESTYNGYEDHLHLLSLLDRGAGALDYDGIERAMRDHMLRVGVKLGYEITAGMNTPLDDLDQ